MTLARVKSCLRTRCDRGLWERFAARVGVAVGLIWSSFNIHAASPIQLQRIRYNNPGTVVDLGVGLWATPFPIDWDSDGDTDLIVLSGGKPDQGTYWFENPGCGGRRCTMPVFKAPVRVAGYVSNAQISYTNGLPRVLSPGFEYPEFQHRGFEVRRALPVTTEMVHKAKGRIRANHWRWVDYDGDGQWELVVGIEDWGDYGWDDAFNEKGEWTRGPLHGYVYLVRDGRVEPVLAGGQPVDVYGMPSPNFADFDGDGDLDLLCGEFLDGFTYFENVGTRAAPRYAPGRRLDVRMDLQMITPVAFDWDRDGDPDLIVGQEDGRVAWIENAGGKPPRFLEPRFFRQEADEVKFGVLVTPFSVDWDSDGDEDLICGNSAGYIGWIENRGGLIPRWAAPVYLEAGGHPIRIMAGANGSIQGPAEAKWGYTTLSVADWDGDGLLDLIMNSIWGKVFWYRNVGSKRRAQLAPAQPVKVRWTGPPPKPAWTWWKPGPDELVTQWRTTPYAIDWTGDGLVDLIMLDQEGYLALFERERGPDGDLWLLPGRRVFRCLNGSMWDRNHRLLDRTPGLIRLNGERAGSSGRRKFTIVDFDRDGRPDLIVNSQNANFLRNEGQGWFRDLGPLADTILAGHDTSPTSVDWDQDGWRDLLIGAEDGYLYYLPNPYAHRGATGRQGRATQ